VDFVDQRLELSRARRHEREALLMLAESLPPSDEVFALDARLDHLDAALARSLERDRADYAAMPSWARPLVVVRGLADRGVLRVLRRAAQKERVEALVRLGAQSKDPLAAQSREWRERAEASLTPLPLPLREAARFGEALGREAASRVIPRLPGLVGLAVGLWIAQTFTDSELSALLHSWGGTGPRHVVRGETLKAMNFWLPMVAAAACSYVGSRVGAYVRAYYAPPAAAEQKAVGQGG
jgi:hypothetical protein